MTITVIQSQDREALRKFEQSELFQQMFGAHQPHVKESSFTEEVLNGWVNDRDGEETSEEVVYCLIVEDNNSEDNATFSLDGDVLEFVMAGVEI